MPIINIIRILSNLNIVPFDGKWWIEPWPHLTTNSYRVSSSHWTCGVQMKYMRSNLICFYIPSTSHFMHLYKYPQSSITSIRITAQRINCEIQSILRLRRNGSQTTLNRHRCFRCRRRGMSRCCLHIHSTQFHSNRTPPGHFRSFFMDRYKYINMNVDIRTIWMLAMEKNILHH